MYNLARHYLHKRRLRQYDRLYLLYHRLSLLWQFKIGKSLRIDNHLVLELNELSHLIDLALHIVVAVKRSQVLWLFLNAFLGLVPCYLFSMWLQSHFYLFDWFNLIRMLNERPSKCLFRLFKCLQLGHRCGHTIHVQLGSNREVTVWNKRVLEPL